MPPPVAPREAEWFAVPVPGTMQQALVEQHRVPDPFIGTNEGAIQWAGLAAWDMRRTLDVTPAMLAHRHLDLVFDGIDTFATVSVNGQVVLKADNAHRTWRVPVRGLLHAGANDVLVRFASPIRALQPMVLKQAHPLPGEYDSAFGDEPKGVQTSPYPQARVPVWLGLGAAHRQHRPGTAFGWKAGTVRGSAGSTCSRMR
jgi:beta-mannosidase